MENIYYNIEDTTFNLKFDSKYDTANGLRSQISVPDYYNYTSYRRAFMDFRFQHDFPNFLGKGNNISLNYIDAGIIAKIDYHEMAKKINNLLNTFE